MSLSALTAPPPPRRRRRPRSLGAVLAVVSALVLAVAGAPSAAAAAPPVGSFDRAAVSGTQAIVSGWALDPDAPGVSTEAYITVNDGIYAIEADLPRPDVNAALGVPGDHGFAASVPLEGGPNEICVYAASVSGAEPTLLECRTTSGPEPLGVVDDLSLGVDDAGVGTLSLAGWSLDPSAPAVSNEIHAYVNGVGYAFTANIPRPDVNNALGVAGDHGFDFTVPLNPGANEVCLFSISASGGANSQLGCESFDLQAAIGSWDGLQVSADGTSAVLSGWAVDPNFPQESTEVHVYNGAVGQAFVADQPRPDVNAALGIDGDHGYQVEVPLTEGVNTLCAFAISFTGGGNTLLGCREVRPQAAIGSLDSVQVSQDGTSALLSGWAVDPNIADQSTEVHVYNGAAGQAFVADQPRPDVNAALGITGDHGFAVEVPLAEGPNSLCAFAISLTGGDNTLLACQDVTGGPAVPDTVVTIGLLNINDFHGRIDANTVKFAGTIEGVRELFGPDNSILLSAGDNIGASLFASSVAQDQPTIDVMNALGFGASAVGNHEFDQGFADLTDRVIGGPSGVDFPYLGANVYEKGTTTPALDEYTVITVQGVRVGIIGAVTQETPTLVSPAGITTLDFGNPVEAVNRVAAQLTDGDEANGEADVLVAEYHEGAGAGTPDDSTLEEEVAAGGAFAQIVTQTSAEVDVIFTGHTHKEYAWDAPIPGVDGATRPILQTGSYGANIGAIELGYDTATGDVVGYAAANIPRIGTDPEDPTTDEELVAAYPRVAAVKTIVDAALANAAAVGNQPVGSVTDDITTAFSGGSYVDGVYVGPAGPQGTGRDDRSKESALGDLVADSLLATLSSPERGGAQIGVVNPGGLRGELYQGEITYAEANAVLPFVNNLNTTTLTGAKFKELLEQQWQTAALPTDPAPSRPYLQLGLSDNVTYTFDASRPQGDRITSITVDGAPIDLGASYRIGTFSFLATGGDNFRAFLDGTDTADSGLIDRDAWIQYLGDNPDLAPDFARQAVEVVGAPTTVTTGSTVTFTVNGLDLTSLGAPQNQVLGALIGDRSLPDVTVTNGSAQVSFTVPDDAPTGEQTLFLVAAPSGTVVSLPITVVAD